MSAAVFTAAELASGAIDAGSRQFVTFNVRDELFGVPLAEVQEIIRVPDLVHVPLAPRNIEGVANLRGAVLPVTSLRRVFAAEPAAHDDATRVVVINQGVPMGFIVDRMARVITAEPDQIDSVDGIRSAVRTELLCGVVKRPDGMILLLDAGRLIAQESAIAESSEPIRGSRHEPAGLPGVSASRATADSVTTDEIQLVSFKVAGEEYAFPIEDVQEIVQVPGSVSRVPCAAAYVVGVMTLRDRLLPLVSLRGMFGLPAAAADDHSRIVVVSPGGGAAEAGWIGVVMDAVNEVLRVNRALVEPVPPLLAGNSAELISICRLEGGKRLVTILSAARMFDEADLRRVVDEVGRSRDMEAGTVVGRDDEEQFVIFRLADEEFGVPIEAVQEIVRVPEDLTSLPLAPTFIEGVVNLRGTVLPVVDQRRRFGLRDAERTDRQRIMVLTLDGARTGFVVDQVSEVLKIGRAQIEPAPSLSAEQARVIRRVANLQRSGRMILLLEPDHMLAGEDLQRVAKAA